MKIIEQSHEILRYDDLSIIERAGRTCYKSEAKIGCKTPVEKCPHWIDNPDHFEYIGPPANLDGSCALTSCEHHSSQKFVRQLIKSGHEAMLEHGHASVLFISNRGFGYEFIRHRPTIEDQNPSAFMATNPAIAQQSTRYVKYDGEMEFIRPVWCDLYDTDKNSPNFKFVQSCSDAEDRYKQLLNLGWRPEQAREVLPNSLKTEIVVTANYREWRHIMKLRAVGTTGKPHPQMQALMLPLLAEFKQKLPVLFEDINFGGETECA